MTNVRNVFGITKTILWLFNIIFMYYVYILPCKDRRYMKIGVSSKCLRRLITHHKSYNIIIDKSRFIHFRNKKLAYKVEEYLLNKIPKPNNKLKIKDGSSELRELTWAKYIIPFIKEIKNDPTFGYNESICMDYELYNITEFIEKIKTPANESKIDSQYEILNSNSIGLVEDRRYVYKSRSTPKEDLFDSL